MPKEALNKLQKTVDGHSKILNEHTTMLKEHDKQSNRMMIAIVKNQEDIREIKETMATKDDIARITTTLDTLVCLVRKKDQELTFMSVRVRRVEDDVEKIKPLVGLA